MTGLDVCRARVLLGLTRAECARVLNVSVSTLYRWEHTEGEIKADPLYVMLLERLQILATSKGAIGKDAKWVGEMLVRLVDQQPGDAVEELLRLSRVRKWRRL